MKKYLIIPQCSDFNRGDQALVWETSRFAKDAGFVGDYYFMAEHNEPVGQSVKQGFNVVHPILEHPSRKFKSKENINMTPTLLLKWGAVALTDFLWSILLLCPLRFIVIPFLTKEKKQLLKLYKEVDAVFIKGGGFIHSYGGATAPYYIYFQLFHIFLAEALGKNVYILPNSFGPFDGLGVKWLVKKAFKNAKLVVAREERSATMCKEQLGMDIPAYPDFGFFLNAGSQETKETFAKKLNLPTNRKWVAITVRPHRFSNSTNPNAAYNKYKEAIAEFAKWLGDNGYFPVFIEQVYAINNHENDSHCIEQIVGDLKKGHFAYYVDRTINCSELKVVYSFFDFIVGTRFHSMIFAMSAGVPGIAITYVGNKGEGIMETMGLQDYYINISNVSSDNLISKFKDVVKNESKLKTQIAKFMNNAENQRNILLSKIK